MISMVLAEGCPVNAIDIARFLSAMAIKATVLTTVSQSKRRFEIVVVSRAVRRSTAMER
jgi:hypothetical protein